MDDRHFDALVKTLAATGSRRATLRAIAASTLAARLTRLGWDEAAAKKKRKRKKKLKKNDFGCVNVGKACRGKDAVCCSGICQGKKPKKGKKDKSRCVAHNVLDCPAGADSCSQAVACGTQKTSCFQTTGQASFCAFGLTGICQPCTKDADCEPVQGPGAACVVCAACDGINGSTGTGCFKAGV